MRFQKETELLLEETIELPRGEQVRQKEEVFQEEELGHPQ